MVTYLLLKALSDTQKIKHKNIILKYKEIKFMKQGIINTKILIGELNIGIWTHRS